MGGSLRIEGFLVLREFAINLTTRMNFGEDSMNVGAVGFGNGKLHQRAPDPESPDMTNNFNISNAIKISGITDNSKALRKKIQEFEWQKGFTNLAQGLAKSSVLLGRNNRENRDG